MVEVWLQKLVDGMQGTVKATIKRAYRNVQEMALEDFIFSHPAQIALLGIQFQWTGDTQVSCCMELSDLTEEQGTGPAGMIGACHIHAWCVWAQQVQVLSQAVLRRMLSVTYWSAAARQIPYAALPRPGFKACPA